MASITQCWPPFLASAGGRRSSSSPVVPPPLSLFSAASANYVPLSSFSPLSTSDRGRAPSTVAAAKKKYIEEDYVVKKVTAKQVEELVKGERGIPVVLDFYATLCGPCILMAQDLEMERLGSKGGGW